MSPPMGNDDVLQRIDTKLDQMLKLAAMQVTANMEGDTGDPDAQHSWLRPEIHSRLLGTTPNTVSVTLAKAKARQRPREIPTVDPASLVPTPEE